MDSILCYWQLSGQGGGRKHSRQHELLDSEDQTSTCPSTGTKNQLANYMQCATLITHSETVIVPVYGSSRVNSKDFCITLSQCTRKTPKAVWSIWSAGSIGCYSEENLIELHKHGVDTRSTCIYLQEHLFHLSATHWQDCTTRTVSSESPLL